MEITIDAPGGVGKNHGANAHAPENAHRKRNFLERVALVEMDAPLHRGNSDTGRFAAHEPPSMANGRRTRKVRDAAVVNARRALQFVREAAQSAAQHHTNARPQLGAGKNELGSAFGTREFERRLGRARTRRLHRNIPTMEAESRFAMVPASIARMPSFASSLRLFGASAPIPPIWIPIELKFAKQQSANVAIVKERGSSAAFIGPRKQKATSSLSTMRMPSRLSIARASCHGTPITHAIGEKSHPKICCREEGTQPMPCQL